MLDKASWTADAKVVGSDEAVEKSMRGIETGGEAM